MLYFVIGLFMTVAGAAAGTWLAGFPADDIGLLLNVSRLCLADSIYSFFQHNALSEALISVLTIRDGYARQFLPIGFRSHFAGIGVLVSFFSYALSSWWLRNIAIKGKKKAAGLETIKKTKSKPRLKDLPFVEDDEIDIGRKVPRATERVHTIFVGGTGSGKTQGWRAYLMKARERGDFGFCIDYNCEHSPSLSKPGDVIISPYSEKYSNYSPLAEMKSAYDALRVSQLIIPSVEGGGEAAEWTGYAQTMLEGILELQWEMKEAGIETTNRDTCLILNSSSPDLLKRIFGEENPAIAFLRDGNEKMVGSVFAIASSKAKTLMSLNPDAGFDSFSISDWVVENADKRPAPFLWAIVPIRFKKVGCALASIISGIYIDACMQLPEVDEEADEKDIPRRWFFADEFGQYPRIACIETGLTAGRKHGQCFVLAAQSFTQLEIPYGDKEARVLFSCLTNRILLLQNDAANAKRCEEEVGQKKIERTMHNTSETTGGQSNSKSSSYNSTVAIESKLLGSNFQSLKPLTGLSWFRGDDDWQFIKKIPVRKLPPKQFGYPEIRKKKKRVGLSTSDKIQMYLELIGEREEAQPDDLHEISTGLESESDSFTVSSNEAIGGDIADDLMSFDDLGLE